MAQNPPPPHLRLAAEIDRTTGTTRHTLRVEDGTAARQQYWIRRGKLGDGGFGTVWLEECVSGADDTRGLLRAVKVTSKRNEKAWRRELNAMHKFSRYTAQFVQLHGWFEHESSLCIAMEYVPNRTLQHYVRIKALPENEAIEVLRQLGQALQYMHQEDFLHRDLKLLNVLVAKPAPDWHVKLADFGISKDLNSMAVTTGEVGTLSYIAPEIFLQRQDRYTKASDIWSLGVIAYRVLAKNPPFVSCHDVIAYGKGDIAFPVQVLERKRCTALAIRFIGAVMAASRDDRPTIGQALADPWLQPDPDSDDEMECAFVASKAWTDTWDQNQEYSEVAIPKQVERMDDIGKENTLLPAASSEALLPSPSWSPNTLSIYESAPKRSNEAHEVLTSEGQVGVAGERELPAQNPTLGTSADEKEAILQQGARHRQLRDAGENAILVAAENGWLQELEDAIKRQGIDYCNADGLTALHYALLGKSIEAADFLLRNGASVDASSRTHGTPLCIAAINANQDAVQLLLNFKADVLAGGGQFGSALHAAAISGNINIAVSLIRYGAELHATRVVCSDFVSTFLAQFEFVTKKHELCYWECQPLFLAVVARKLDMVRFLVRAGADVNAGNRYWEADHAYVEYLDADAKCKLDNITALHIAARINGASIVEFLISVDANVDKRDSHGGSAVSYCAVNNSCQSLEILKGHGASLHYRDEDGYNCLDEAAFWNNLEALKLLLEYGMNPTERDHGGYTALSMAAQRDSVDCVKALCHPGAVIDNQSKTGHTPLYVAAERGRIEVIKSLVEAGAGINSVTNEGATALHIAAQFGHVEIVKSLVGAGAGIDSVTNKGATALHLAANLGHVEIVKSLVEAGAGIDSVTNKGSIALHFAAQDGHVEIVKLLLEYGAGIDSVTNEGATALHTAARHGHVEIVKLLLEYGAGIDSVTNEAATALHTAARLGHVETVKSLVEAGAGIDLTTNNGRTALYLAAQYGHVEIVKLLVEARAGIDLTANNGATALHTAVARGNVELVWLLVDYGADVNLALENGLTPLMTAAHGKSVEIAKLLVEHGAKSDVTDAKGRTAIQWAAESRDNEGMMAFLRSVDGSRIAVS